MTAYIVRHADSMKLALTTSFATEAEAQSAMLHLATLDGAQSPAEYSASETGYRIETLWAYGTAAQHHFVEEQKATRTADRLITAITEHLDAVDGAVDEDEFIAEHEELAEAIGYEFEVTEDIEVRLTVSVTKKRGRDIDEDDLDIQVDASYGTFTVNDTAWEVR